MLNPFLTFLVCVPSRLIMGFVPGLIYKLCSKENNKTMLAMICSLLVPILNTLLFIGTLILCFYNTEFIVGLRNSSNSNNVIEFFVFLVGVNGLVEMLVGAFVSYPIIKTLEKVNLDR